MFLQTAISTALPTIIHDLNGEDYVWVGSAYTLASTAILPLCGGIAQIFGRRPTVLAALVLFAIGSGLSGGATGMTMLIVGRTIQGLGGGAIMTLTEIVIADLVTLAERGVFMGIFGV